MNKIPVVFIHFNRPSNTAEPFRDGIYKATSEQAIKEGNDVYFISNQKFQIEQDTFSYVPMKGYWPTSMDVFQKNYENLSTNNAEIELICFLRWFVLLDFMEKNDIPVVFHADTDVMIYCDVTEDYKNYQQFGMTLIHRTCGSSSFITKKSLKKFCGFLSDLYENKDSYEFAKMKNVYLTRLDFGLHGGVCDMTLLETFQYNSNEGGGPCRVGEMMHVVDEATYDHNFNVDDGVYNHTGEHKDVKFHDGKPYCFHQGLEAPVRFKCLHLQGAGKKFLKKLIKEEKESYEKILPHGVA